MRRRITLLGGMLLAGVAHAADGDSVGHWYVLPQIGATLVDHDRNVDDDLFYGLTLGRHLSEAWSAELSVVTGSHDGDSGTPDIDITALSADLLRVFDRGSAFAPYLTAGVGVIDDNPDPGMTHKSFMAQAGVGALIRVWESASGAGSFSLRPEVKARWDGNHGQRHPLDGLVGIGFQLAFGAPRSVAAAAAPAPMPPPAAPLPPPATTPPSDSDGDGVLDDRDRCADTPRGTAVDGVGCPVKGSITLAGVRFENDSARLTQDSSASLDPVAASLQPYPRLRIEIQGHTDAVGSDAYNLKLSQARAESVREYLVAHGVSASQLTAKGYGETQPVADNKTAAGRAENRRVVMSVLENPGDVEVRGSAEER